MSKTATTTTLRKRKGYLIPIEGSELEGKILHGWKYVRIRQVDFSKRRNLFSSEYYKKVRVWACVYCGQESHYMAIFQYSGHNILERLCQKCVKVHGPIPDSNSNSVPVCNLL
jgi:hypothetical protein